MNVFLSQADIGLLFFPNGAFLFPCIFIRILKHHQFKKKFENSRKCKKCFAVKAQKLENKNPPSELFSTHCSKASCMYVVFDIKSRVLWWSVHIIHARRNLLLDTSWCITLVWNNNPGLSYLDKDELHCFHEPIH